MAGLPFCGIAGLEGLVAVIPFCCFATGFPFSEVIGSIVSQMCPGRWTFLVGQLEDKIEAMQDVSR